MLYFDESKNEHICEIPTSEDYLQHEMYLKKPKYFHRVSLETIKEWN